MARLSDIIEEFIKDMMKENQEEELEIVRNELANYFSCAPSQINYVLTTRFTNDKGYYIESKRGGGGCIRIRRIQVQNYKPLFSIINEKIGNNITYDTGVKIIEGLYEARYISEKESNIMKAAINERALSNNTQDRNTLRADILKSMITVILL
ncbi:CtsR family transcriptional regulator [Clostridium sp. KNHs214]|uniref:CtsR family transcriptional regulator n=1 Tax=Clostridium sp. KNHs214 TaxID=1540257 RepID=UPI0005523981|nr:CtsR family transcriptional regulator [Clostridium sp. KNHs214]